MTSQLTVTRWTVNMVAISSISHGGDESGSTESSFRRERIILPNDDLAEIPIISGNSFRGILRRIGFRLLADVLGFDELPLPIAHTLTNGGNLTKTQNDPLSGRRLAELRSLNPLLSVFGGCGGGRIISGCLQVGKVLPVIAETTHMLDDPPATTLTQWNVVSLESYSRLASEDSRSSGGVVEGPGQRSGGGPMRFSVETMAAGTRLQSWIQLDHPTDTELAFMREVLHQFTATGHLGGRRAVGHGQVRTTLSRTGPAEVDESLVDWRRPLQENRERALEVLQWLI